MIEVNQNFSQGKKGLWSVRFYIGKEKYFRGLKTKDRQEANKRADEFVREVMRELRLGVNSLGTVIDSYLNVQKDKTTHDADKFRFNVLLDKLGDIPMSKLTREGCQNFFLDLIREPSPRTGKLMTSTTQRAYLVSYKGLMNYAIDNGKIDFNPFNFYKKGQAPKYKPKGREFSEAEIGRLVKTLKEINKTKTKSLLWRQFYYFFLLMYYSGARERELLHLKWNDFQIVDEKRVKFTILEQYAKNREARNVEIPKWVWDELSTITKLSEYTSKEFVFDLARRSSDVFGGKMWRIVKEKSGVTEGRLYDVKHTYISQRVRENVNPVALKEQVGHSLTSKITHDVYTHSSDADRKVLVGKTKKIG